MSCAWHVVSDCHGAPDIPSAETLSSQDDPFEFAEVMLHLTTLCNVLQDANGLHLP